MSHDILDDDVVDRQREIARQIHIHERIREAGAFSMFQPSSFQIPWFQTERKITTLIKGNQVGGTTCLVVRMLSACLGTKPTSMGGIIPPDWGKLRIREKPGMYLLMGKSFTKTIPEVLLPKIREFLTPDMLRQKPKKHPTGVPYIFYFKSGAELHIGSYDQDAESFEGPLWNGVGFDEPPERDIYVACRRGTMKTRGWIMFTMTPLKNLWVYDELHVPGQQGRLPDVAAFEAHSHLNCTKCNPGEGHIDHDELNSFFANLSPNERRARELGIPLDISNIRYYFVQRESHVVPDIGLDSARWPLVEVVDPSMTRGLYVIWAKMDPRTERWFVVHAAHIEDAAVSVMVEGVKRERRFVGRDPDVAIMDAKGGAHIVDKEREESWFMRFRNHGLDYEPNDEPAGLEELDEWLRPVWDPVLEKQLPKLSICERVADLSQGPLWALQRFQWDPLSMTKKAMYQQPGKDFVDCLKYLVNQRSVNRSRLRRDRGKSKQRARYRHEKLAASYGFGHAPKVSRPSRHLIWSPPTYR